MRRLWRLALFALATTACDRKPAVPPVLGAAPPPGVVRYIIGGDSRDDSSHVLPWAFREAGARGATAFFFLGDMELTPQLDEHFRSALPLLGPVAFYPALGNHEVRVFGELNVAHDEAEATFRKRFLDTTMTPVHSSIANKVVYSVNLAGGVHLVALDNVSQKGFGAQQLAWLEADLAKASANPEIHHTIVGMHKPLAHNGKTTHSMDADGPGAIADSDAVLALLVKSHVSLIVASHLHAYLPYDTAGIPSYITGGLGAPLDRGGPDYAFHHFLQVDVTPSDVHVTVVRFDGKASQGDGTDSD
jgi:Calcineurin-like phosphoesterase